MSPFFERDKDARKPSDDRRAGRHERPSAPDASPTREAIAATLKGHLETVWRSDPSSATRQPVGSDDDLYESGAIDSLSAARFLLLAEEHYGIKLPDWLLGGRGKSLSGLAEHIAKELARKRA
jgi:acyl carrier protein